MVKELERYGNKMDSRDELLLKEVNLHEMMNNIDDDDEERCKSGNIECESGRSFNRLCSDCQADAIDTATDAAKERRIRGEL